MRRLLTGVLVLVAIGTAAPPASAQVQRLISFDRVAEELPEGIAVDKRGTIYISFPFRGELVAVDRNGARRVVAKLPVGEGFGPIGLAVDAPGNVYVGVSTFEAATNGVYRVTRDGVARRIPGTADIGLPNGVALDKRGNLYVTDSIRGAVWRVPRNGTGELWLQDDLLVGDNSAPPPFPIGANGIVHRQRTLYVANSELGSIVAVPIRADGSPGDPFDLVRDAALELVDGLAIDVHGALYAGVVGQDTIMRVSRGGSRLTTLATADDGLDFPSSLAFGTGNGQRRTLYIVNFAAGPLFGLPEGAGPALLALANDTPGQPMP